MAVATAQLKNYRQAPRKVRLVADFVRGKSVTHALSMLETLPKRASTPLAKLIRSAVANAKSKGVGAEDLFVESMTVNEAPVLKRIMPRARGSASQILKRSSHVSISLGEKAPKKSKKQDSKDKEASHTS